MAHTYSGYENTVAVSIQQAVENRNMHDLIAGPGDFFQLALQVLEPAQDGVRLLGVLLLLLGSLGLLTVTEITDNGPKTVERKVFPGYVLVKMIMTDETWHLVRNIRGVTGFVGPGSKPIPLTEAEIARFGVETRATEVNYAATYHFASSAIPHTPSWQRMMPFSLDLSPEGRSGQ